ncbi:PqqD family protein [bacterium]|nr:PqqD family protein [bacterium]
MVAKKPRFHPQVKHTIIKDEGLIIAQENGDVHIVNEVASFLLPFINGEFTVEQLADKVTEAYDVDKEMALHDIEAFLNDLEKKKVIIYD